MDGYENGFPVLFDNGLTEKRGVEVMQYLMDGNYLDRLASGE